MRKGEFLSLYKTGGEKIAGAISQRCHQDIREKALFQLDRVFRIKRKNAKEKKMPKEKVPKEKMPNLYKFECENMLILCKFRLGAHISLKFLAHS